MLVLAAIGINTPKLCADIIGVQFNDGNAPLVEIDSSNGSASLIGSTGWGPLHSLARDSQGRLFSVDPGSGLIQIDEQSGVGQLVQSTPIDIRGLAFSTNDVLYGVVDGGVNNAEDQLVTIDVDNGNVVLVGSTGLSGIQALDFSSSGALYAYDIGHPAVTGSERGLVTLNTITGAFSDITSADDGDSGLTVQSIAENHLTGQFFAVDTLQNAYSIDPTTAAVTFLYTGGFGSIRGIEFQTVPEPGVGLLFSLVGMAMFARRSHSRHLQNS